jgi:hypothetical protein
VEGKAERKQGGIYIGDENEEMEKRIKPRGEKERKTNPFTYRVEVKP